MSANLAPVVASEPSNATGYRSFGLGKFELSRDAYFVSVRWPAKGARRTNNRAGPATGVSLPLSTNGAAGPSRAAEHALALRR